MLSFVGQQAVLRRQKVVVVDSLMVESPGVADSYGVSA